MTAWCGALSCRETVEFLYEHGAKDVHIRSACPPILYGCKFLNFSRSNSENELIARATILELEGEEGLQHLDEYMDGSTQRGKNMRQAICKKLHFASLEYQSLDGHPGSHRSSKGLRLHLLLERQGLSTIPLKRTPLQRQLPAARNIGFQQAPSWMVQLSATSPWLSPGGSCLA